MTEPDPNEATVVDEQRFMDGIRDADCEDFEAVMRSALILERKMYSNENTVDALFRLRKSLEGIWGHDLP